MTPCRLAVVGRRGGSKEPVGLFRPRNGECSSHGDFGIYQATRCHTCEDRDVSVLILRLEELKSSRFVSSERPTAVNSAAGDVTRPVKETCRRLGSRKKRPSGGAWAL